MSPINHDIAFALAKARHADLIREADEFRRAAAAKRLAHEFRRSEVASTRVRFVRAGRRARSTQQLAFR